MKWFVGWSEEKINLDDDDVTFVGLIFWGVRSFGHQLKSGMHSKLDINTYTHTEYTHLFTVDPSALSLCVCILKKKFRFRDGFYFIIVKSALFFFIHKKNPEKGQKVRARLWDWNVHSLLKYFFPPIFDYPAIHPTHIDNFLEFFFERWLVLKFDPLKRCSFQVVW